MSLLIPFGLDPRNNIVSAADVPRGLACGCKCLECSQPLLAAQGRKRQPYFRHFRPNKKCSGGVQTALHMKAVQILTDIPTIHTPGIQWERAETLPNGQYVALKRDILPAGEQLFRAIEIEQTAKLPRAKAQLRPDARALIGDVECFVEIHVTNAVSEDKERKLEQIPLPTLEIHLPRSTIPDDLEELERLITEAARRSWLSIVPDTGFLDEFDAKKKRALLLPPCPKTSGRPLLKQRSKLTDDRRVHNAAPWPVPEVIPGAEPKLGLALTLRHKPQLILRTAPGQYLDASGLTVKNPLCARQFPDLIESQQQCPAGAHFVRFRDAIIAYDPEYEELIFGPFKISPHTPPR